VTEDEARALLLSIDPLAALAQSQAQLHARLLELAPAAPDELRQAWREAADASLRQSPPASAIPFRLCPIFA
jgi:hypothetical protein